MDGISNRLLERGAKLYEGGIVMIKTCLIAGLVLLVITLVTTGENVGEALTFQAYSTFTNILVAAAYLAILASLFGIRLYLLGLHYLGLGQIARGVGQIAKNTDQ